MASGAKRGESMPFPLSFIVHEQRIIDRASTTTISSVLGHAESLAGHDWVEWDEAKCVDATVTMAVQVNGKVRAKISLAPDAAEDAAKELAFAEEGVVKFTEGKDVKKVIYVPGKILNIVAK